MRKEELLQYLWKHRCFPQDELLTAGGRRLQILSPGELNTDSGPDFSNARICIDGLVLAGNVEIHVCSSDWERHAHQNDSAYDKIILHVVYRHDRSLEQNSRHQVEVLELRNYITKEALAGYEQLLANHGLVACSPQLVQAPDMVVSHWLQVMLEKRLQVHLNRVQQIFTECRGDYSCTLYVLLFRNFGFRTNAVPFEMLARQLPMAVLMRTSDKLHQLEALLLGMAGQLEGQLQEPYCRFLQNEFEFLKRKYDLQPLPAELFKYSRLRPANFPVLRLAQLAAFFHNARGLLSDPFSLTGPDALINSLRVPLQGYFAHHYCADGREVRKQLVLGRQSAENIVINTLAPFLLFSGIRLGRQDYQEHARLLLETCAPENNFKTRYFRAKRRLIKNAACSQALIQLTEDYCRKKKCLECEIGKCLLRRSTATEVSAKPVIS